MIRYPTLHRADDSEPDDLPRDEAGEAEPAEEQHARWGSSQVRIRPIFVS